MKGLIIKPYWGNKILCGEKKWEIRGQNTKHRGNTEIIYSGSGHRFGSATLVDSIPITKTMFESSFDKHQIETWIFNVNHYKHLFAWVFESPQFHSVPMPYKHPQGAVIWVNLVEDCHE